MLPSQHVVLWPGRRPDYQPVTLKLKLNEKNIELDIYSQIISLTDMCDLINI